MSQQGRLFADDLPQWEADAEQDQLVAQVIFPTGPPEPLDYRVPDRLRVSLQVGCRVRAPLGRGDRPVVGYCVALDAQSSTRRRLKELLGVVDRRSLLSPAMLRLTQWISAYYLCPWPQVLEAVVPAGVRGQAGTREAVLLSLAPETQAQLEQLKLPAKQLQALRHLATAAEPLTPQQLAHAVRTTIGPIQALRKKGLIVARRERIEQHLPTDVPVERRPNHVLNADQRRALEAILAALHAAEQRTILLHGVTGSGKTEVYIQAIQEVVRFGRQAIVLVPEISLTPQTLQRFRERFARVAVLHSHLTDVERNHHWQRIAAGEVEVIVGARSAVFAPTPHLGLIIIDEEHETTFKQETAPRYHAREVALERTRAERLPLVLGSATPSLESWQRCVTSEFQLIELPRRVEDRPLPVVKTVDLRTADREHRSPGILSRPLRLQIDQALADGGQVILLLNRRGFSTHIQCPACGLVIKCPHCDIALTHHRQGETAMCHHCDYRQPAPRQCPECQATGIRYSGTGTQRLEYEVRGRFPGVKCARMDTDSMQSAGHYEQVLAAFREGDVRILLGTQMIAKGLDFPNVTLVGVVQADMALHLPDFRAAERTFQLLVQVAGRTGRSDRGGRVLVQTLSPEHYAIQAAVTHDYGRFARQELPEREQLGYPPFGRLIRLVIRGPSETLVHEFGETLAEQLRSELAPLGEAYRVLGPAPAPIARLRGDYRHQIHLHGPEGLPLRQAVSTVAERLTPPDDVLWIADVDPLGML
ncbi:MAG: primosomal protein N' [Pirellulales bacterium]|nr:primosomal protein N' [Pirellulales bacterium]